MPTNSPNEANHDVERLTLLNTNEITVKAELNNNPNDVATDRPPVATKQFSTDKAFTYASFLGAILAIPLTVFAFVSPRWMYLLILMTAGGMVWLKLKTCK